VNLCFISPSVVQRPEIYDLAKHLPEKYNITILQPCYKSLKHNGFNLRENISVKYVAALFLPLRNSIITVPYTHLWIMELFNMIKKTSCDLIHACDYEYFTSMFPKFAKKSYDIPITIVNDSLLGIGGYSLGSSTLDTLSRVYTLSIGKKILGAYDRVIVLYSKLANLMQKLGLPTHKIFVIPNGINTLKIDAFRKTLNSADIRYKYGIKEEEHVILYVGRLVSVKRIYIIIKVVQNLVQEGYKVRALIVGDGPLRNNLESLASSVRNNITFTGSLFGKEKYECYSIAKLFMLPSQSEGLPTVLLEASAMGVPSVATNVNGIPDIILHSKTGFLVERTDIKSYMKYAKELIENDDLATEMGKNARAHVVTNFSWKSIAKQYEKIFQSLV
jgi:glycosyltransferase involved in cell wall biosynthesis